MDLLQHKPHTTPKDFFLYLATMAGLYVSAISFIALLWQYINVLFPDPLVGYYDPYSAGIRFSIASLVIIFPLYLFFTRLVNKDVRRNPEKKEIGIRKWLVYLTLFVAGVTIVIDLIALIREFLGGELTVRFGLKALVTLIVALVVFGYYFYDLRGKWEREEKKSKVVGAVLGSLVLASVIGGFFIIGSPFAQRVARLDEQRVFDLENIQYQVITYWQQREALPKSIDDLESPLTGYVLPRDPETREPYTYRATGNLSFELCATFATENMNMGLSIAKPIPPRGIIEGGMDTGYWNHPAGEHCFTRTIDPALFPPFPKGF